MPPPLETELKAILEACRQAQVPVFVVGAFSVRAYDCLQRISQTWIARLAELAERIRGGEAMSIWYERTGLILSDAETQSAVAQLHRLQQARP